MRRQTVDILVGGFGILNGEHSPGIEQFELQGGSEHRQRAGESVSLAESLFHRRRVLAEVPSPTWMLRNGSMLYAVLENTNEIATLRLDGSHSTLRSTLLSTVHSAGSFPNHAAVVNDDAGAEHLVVTNYVDGSVGVHPVDNNGFVLEATQMLRGEGHGLLPAQEGPHAHWVLPLPDHRVLTTDLGADRVYVHRWQDGELVRVGVVTLAPGTGPRDMHLLPGSHELWHVAVVGEWGGVVTVLAPDQACRGHESDQDIKVVQIIELGRDDKDQAASLAFSPDTIANDRVSGFVYVGLRGSDRIVTLHWDGRQLERCGPAEETDWTGRGITSGGGRPRHLLAVGHMLLAANETADTIAMFTLADDGMPKPIGSVPAGSPTVMLPW